MRLKKIEIYIIYVNEGNRSDHFFHSERGRFRKMYRLYCEENAINIKT